MHRELAPDGLGPPAANYAHAVLSTGVTRMLHSSGIVPTAPDGTVADDVGAQAEEVWRTISTLLADAEMAPTDMVSVTTYIVEGQPLGPVMSARDTALGGHRAASTLVVVPSLAQAAWKMEVAIVATA